MEDVLAGLVLISMLASGPAGAASSEDETIMAKGSKVTLQEAMASATATVPGRVLWSSRENFDGATYIMVEVIAGDRSDHIVTIEQDTGQVVKTELAKPKPAVSATTTGKEAKARKPAKPLKGATIEAGDAKQADLPYMARISMEDAIAAVLKKHKGRLIEVYVFAEAGYVLYGIEVSSRVGRITLAKVDAGTGKVLTAERM